MERSSIVQYSNETTRARLWDQWCRVDTKRHLRPPMMSIPMLVACDHHLLPVGTTIAYDYGGACVFRKIAETQWSFETPKGFKISAFGGFKEIFERFILLDQQKN